MRWNGSRTELGLDDELLKKAEMSLREAGNKVTVVAPYVRDGKVCHPDLDEKGELKRRKR